MIRLEVEQLLNIQKREKKGMNSLVLIVEDETQIKDLLARFLEKAGISFIFASNVIDAIELFEHNKEMITFIALDGNLGGPFNMEYPETLYIAQLIANSLSFKGTVYAMSSNARHNKVLKKVIGDKCEILLEPDGHIKTDTIKEIIKRIKEKREMTSKSR